MRRRPHVPVQARTVQQLVGEVAERYACSECRISYAIVRGQKPQCPLCDARRRITELQGTMTALRNQLELTSNSATTLQGIVDVQSAMRRAADMLDDNDRTFLKSVLYRYRADSFDIALKVVHGRPARQGGAPRPNGFLVLPRQGEPEAHICTSVGGVALAAYFLEEARCKSNVAALVSLIRALGPALAEAVQE